MCFIYEAFRQLRPGVPLLALHGKMKQMKRLAVFARFCDSPHGRRTAATERGMQVAGEGKGRVSVVRTELSVLGCEYFSVRCMPCPHPSPYCDTNGG